ncbi:MAG: DUF4304 domain-containing protein [Gammaproteobacteria bacterium]|nr:DUF4304 domain-containing protein [Gammaproteobacteria bacterium]MBU1413992.1 DUF4304 domain-containing protein [Gammaproteobacteria bacterium]
MTVPASKLLNDFLKKSIVPALKNIGFDGKGRVWTRSKDDGIQLVDIQNWKYNDPAQARFTIEFGICFPDMLAEVAKLDEFAFHRPYLNKPDIVVCQVRERLGMLLDEPQDTWWSVNAEPAQLPDPAEILVPLLDRAVPWLDARSSLSALVESGEAGGGVFGIAARAACDRRDEVMAEAREYSKRRHPQDADAEAALFGKLVKLIEAVPKKHG